MRSRTEMPWLPDRTLRAAVVAPWVAGALAVLLTIAAIWLDSEKGGWTALVVAILAVVLGLTSGISGLPTELTRRARYDAEHPQDRKDAR